MPNPQDHESPKGRLFVVATPIGNLEDITLRALRVLREVSAIACEDTRQTRKLLAAYNIKKRLISYFHPRERQKMPLILSLLHQGQDVALVTDAGTPGISDPGYPLIREALMQGIRVVPIPGPSAVTAALSASGLPTHRFVFLSFPSPKREAGKKLLESVKGEPGTLIFFLPARRLKTTLNLVREVLGDRSVVIAREITKIHEEFTRKKISEVLRTLEERALRGELTLLVQGTAKKPSRPDPSG
ncbi:MAG: 16S rRNA (cytidine(1402)-2'-O)-methyltransferase [Candidatus Aminicenantales bacterium]